MGKILIVGIFVIAALFIVIILSVRDRVDNSPELLSKNLTELQAKALCREAINYGIKKVNDAGDSGLPTTHMQTFVDFQIGNGIIDSIQYTTINDTVSISAYASYQNNNDTYQHKSTALVTWAPKYENGAIVANGDIDVTGSAVVNGDLIPDVIPLLDFEEFFGMTKAEMQAIADNDMVDPRNNPGGISGITYMSFSGSYPGTLMITTTSWNGTGILVVDGDANFTGGSFTGIMWIVGRLRVNGNNGFYGAIYVEGIGPGGEILPVPVSGDCEITYDETAIMLALGYVGQILTYELKIISIFEDD